MRFLWTMLTALTMALALTLSLQAQITTDIKVVAWEDSSEFSEAVSFDWTGNKPVTLLIPNELSDSSQIFSVQYYNPVDASWYELQYADGSYYEITVDQGVNGAVILYPSEFVGAPDRFRLRSGTLASPDLIYAEGAGGLQFYIFYRLL